MLLGVYVFHILKYSKPGIYIYGHFSGGISSITCIGSERFQKSTGKNQRKR